MSYLYALDDCDTSEAIPNVCPESLRVVRQANGVIRIHANNGAYLFSLERSQPDGIVFAFSKGFGEDIGPIAIHKEGSLKQ